MTRGAAGRGDDISLDALRQRILRRRLPGRGWLAAGVLALCLGTALPPIPAWGQRAATASHESAANPLAEPPRSWAVDAVANELLALHHRGSYLRYRMHVVDVKNDYVRDVIESKDGTVARMILKDGRALTEEEDKAERQRLNDMIASPSDYAKHVQHEEEGKKLADRMMRLLPDAMIYSYTPGQPQTGKNNGALEVVLDYEPNPKFNPPMTTAEALTGLKGRVWIDAKTRQLVRMDGTIFRAVNFGWGMLAHIYPGGQLMLEQTNAGGNRWIFTRFIEQVKVRALLVKTININTRVEAGSFETLPGPIPYQDAVRMLLDTPLPKK
ncbi:MAG: hypothetical protein J0G35_01355 [Acidobacteriales bacterium]|nr:hypothetical protein [Terriglobales bacterium]